EAFEEGERKCQHRYQRQEGAVGQGRGAQQALVFKPKAPHDNEDHPQGVDTDGPQACYCCQIGAPDITPDKEAKALIQRQEIPQESHHTHHDMDSYLLRCACAAAPSSTRMSTSASIPARQPGSGLSREIFTGTFCSRRVKERSGGKPEISDDVVGLMRTTRPWKGLPRPSVLVLKASTQISTGRPTCTRLMYDSQSLASIQRVPGSWIMDRPGFHASPRTILPLSTSR